MASQTKSATTAQMMKPAIKGVILPPLPEDITTSLNVNSTFQTFVLVLPKLFEPGTRG